MASKRFSAIDCMVRLKKSGFSDEQAEVLAKGFEELKLALEEKIKIEKEVKSGSK